MKTITVLLLDELDAQLHSRVVFYDTVASVTVIHWQGHTFVYYSSRKMRAEIVFRKVNPAVTWE